MKYKEIAASIVLILLVCYNSKAQNGSYELRNVIPPSANVASLGKYGEVPVSLYTGIPNISIPLYEVKDGPLSVPISLSYHAGGIRVEEIASSVGLGWTLNAGGIVGRQMRGIADENGWVTDAPNRIANILQSGTQGQKDLMTINIEEGTKDGEADIYYYNFNGQSGKFFFDQAGTLYNYPAKNVSVFSGGFNGDGWKIITEDGTVYEFYDLETVMSISCKGGDSEAKTAWYLSKITSSDGKRQISFTYENVTYSATVFLGQTKYFTLNGFGGCLNTDPAACEGSNIFYTHRLKRIDFTGGYVKFNYNNARQDVYSGDDKSLDQIEIYTSGNSLIKKYDLAYSYFGAGGSSVDDKRLKLTSLTEKSATSQKPPFTFTYEESIQLPNRLSMSTDHWGYYNGKTNTSRIGTFEFLNPVTGLPYIFYGADRNANPATMQAGILKKIQYPTGGETEYTYECNTTLDSKITPATYDQYYYYSLNQSYSSLTSPYETTSFTIPSQGADVKFSVSGLTTSNSYCNYEVKLRCYLIKDNNTTTPYVEITDGTNGIHLKLPGGTYKFRFTFDGCYTGNLNYSINLHNKIPVLSEMGKRPVGGLRIKQVEDKPGNGGQSVIRKYRYEYEDDPTKSSGVLMNFPEYGYVLDVDRNDYAYPYCYVAESCKYLVQQSKTNYPLATSQGSYVGYRHVIEDLGDNGEVRHWFNAYSQPNPPFPFPPLDYSEWQQGVETATKYYAKKNGQLVLSKEISYVYNATNLNMVKGYMVGRNYIITGPCGNLWGNAPLTTYNVIPQFWALYSTSEIVYDQNDPAKSINTTTNYTYNPIHYQVTQVKTSTTSSDPNIKDEILVNKKYAQDYSFTGTPYGSEALGIKKLQDLHIVNVPLEEYSYRQKRNITTNALSDQRVISGTIMSFRSDYPYPDQIYRLETNATIPLATYGNGSGISSNAFIKNANSTVANAYKNAITFLSYDSYGNLTSQVKANDVYNSYLWGYGGKYPVAQVVGATYSSISSYVNQSVLDNPASDVAVRNEINNIRTGLSSSKALVTTYTYKQLVGQTSITDPNNRTVYYSYDDFGRLDVVRDQDNNIVKKYCYNYFGQAENCIPYVNTNQSGNYYSQNCGSQTPLAYYVSIPAGMFTSTVSVQDANNQAAAYGLQQANQSGGCSAPQTSIDIYNWTDNTYYLYLYNTTTSQNYNLTINPSGFSTLNIPMGTYNVTVQTGGYATYMNVLGYGYYGTMVQYFNTTVNSSSTNTINFGD
jgi:YD repeat-containing protein